MNKQPFLSVIIPVYNESKRLNHLPEIVKFFKNQDFTSEIVIINDGSTDDTLQDLTKLKKKYHFQILDYKINRGKGYAIKTGMLNSKGQYKLFTDIDLSTPLNELNKFLPYIKNSDVIIGTRKTDGSVMINRQPFLREFLGKGFTLLSQIILQTYVSDFTCGFKLFSDKAAKEIFGRLTIDRWGFDSEVLFIARKRGLRIKEISVIWKHDPLTKVKFPQDIIRSLYDLIRIRFFTCT